MKNKHKIYNKVVGFYFRLGQPRQKKRFLNMVIDCFNCITLSIYTFYTKIKRRSKNRHNNTFLKSYVNIDSVIVGNYSYGPLDIRLGKVGSHVQIGSYCSIAEDVVFICGNDHNYKQVSTYIFGSGINMWNKKLAQKYGISDDAQDINNERCGKEFIIIDDDVWIGTGAKIMSGVHIGQGAVIASGAVVTKDVPPYAIVGGIPAKVIKYRFSKELIKKLLKINYSNIPIENFAKIYEEMVKEDFNIDYILDNIYIH